MYASSTPLTPGMSPVVFGHNKQPIKLGLPIKIFSIINIVIGIVSIALQIATIVLLADGVNGTTNFDYVAAGIWGGLFYVFAGCLGVAAPIKRIKGLLVGTLVMASISLASAITASVLSAITAGSGYYYDYYYPYYYYCNIYFSRCESWVALEWCLMSFSVMAIINNIVLVSLVSVPTCCGMTKKPKVEQQSPSPSGPVVMINGQPVYLQQSAGNKGAYIMPSYVTAMPPQQYNPPDTLYPSLQLQPQDELKTVPSAPPSPKVQQPVETD